MSTTDVPIRNWAGNVQFGAVQVHRPGSIDELRRTVASSGRIRALGNGHSFSLVADTTDDLISALVQGTTDGRVTEDEVLLNCENLVGATENGRLALAGGMLAFLEHPDQWRLLSQDRGLLPTAVEEILRWTSSATHSMRSAIEPQVIRGQRIAAGERVVLWLPSANRDEAVFPEPYRFHIGRSPNRHLALGSGEHFCLGATLARAQMRILFAELLDTARHIEQRGPAAAMHSIAVNGPETLPVRIAAR